MTHSQAAEDILKEKLAALSREWATTSDEAKRFDLEKQIDRTKSDITKLKDNFSENGDRYAALKPNKLGWSSATIMGVAKNPHSRAIQYDISIVYTPGTDEGAIKPLRAVVGPDTRTQTLGLGFRNKIVHFPQLDEIVLQSHSIILLISRNSLSLLQEAGAPSAFKIIRSRCAVFALLVGVSENDIPEKFKDVFLDVFPTSSNEWDDPNKDLDIRSTSKLVSCAIRYR